MKINWFKHAAPISFYPLAGRMVLWFAVLAFVTTILGLYWGFFETPERLGGSNPQKEYYRIIFIHVPSAWMSMWLYVVMAGWSAIGLIFNSRLSFMMTSAVAPTGALPAAVKPPARGARRVRRAGDPSLRAGGQRRTRRRYAAMAGVVPAAAGRAGG